MCILKLRDWGTLVVSTAYGGDSFVIVDAAPLGFAIEPDEAKDMATMGMNIVAAANEQLGFTHPTNPDWDHLSFCQFAGPLQSIEGVLSRAEWRCHSARKD